jgi:hypothetical protein
MTPHHNIYNIGYRGASGGFLFLHFLLLSDQYYTDIFNNVNFSDVVAQQWNVSDHKNWKATEFWPDNFKSINDDSGLNRIAYFCNPSTREFFQKRQSMDTVSLGYNNVKDPAWPALTSAADLVDLPKWIYDELCNTLDCKNTLSYLLEQTTAKSVWLYTDINSQNELAYYKKAYFYHNQLSREKIQDLTTYTEMWNGVSVDKSAVYFLNNSNIQVKLQDLVNVPESLIDCGLINNVNQKQYDLLKHWKSLHPPELLQKIGIK